jgi:lipoprotein-anchoring transpeptidase ErfK/SrfK/5-hydroxyisourate hydrolase-like protein (transthyretin family)
MPRKIISIVLSALLTCGLLGASLPAFAHESEGTAPGADVPLISGEGPSDTSDTEQIAGAETPDTSEDAVDDTESPKPDTATADDTPDTAATDEPAASDATDTAAATTTTDPTSATSLAPLEGATSLSPGTYYIRPAISHTRVLDVSSGSKASRANIQLYAANKTAAQRFRVEIKNGYYTITNENSGLVLDVSGAKATSGTNVWQYGENSTPAQRWTARLNSDGSYTLISALSTEKTTLVLDVAAGKNANGANVQIYKENNTAAQHFYFMDVTPRIDPSEQLTQNSKNSAIYTLTSALPAASAFVLDVPAASDNSGVRPQLYTPNNTPAQMFHFSLQDGYYLISSIASGLALDVTGASPMATASIQQYPSNGSDAQRWALRIREIRDDGVFVVGLISKASGMALEVSGTQAKTGALLQQNYPNDASLAQNFILSPVDASVSLSGYVSFTSYANKTLRIDIASGSRQPGANVQAYRSNTTAAQRFEVEPTDMSSVYAFRSLASGLYLTQEGANVCQMPADKTGLGLSQRWRITRVAGGVTLVSLSGMSMTLFSSNIAATTPDNSTSQIFRISSVPVIEPGYYVISTATGLALDVKGASTAKGANVQLYTKNNTSAQKWNLTATSDGSYTITNAASRKALDIAGGASTEGTNVQQWDANGSAAQRWKIVPTGDGWFSLQAQDNTSFLSAADTGTAKGANVYISKVWDVSNNAQKFTFVGTTYTAYSGTYADVNLTTQKMFFVKNGEKVVESDIVTGAPRMATPPGTFRLQGKASPSVLVGPGYRAPVTYWMPFSGGIGFHDASWQPWFGGNRYLTNGSHGCINMPLEAARTLYSYISVGDTVQVHY